MEDHYRELLRFPGTRLGDRHAAADVTHDAYLRALERSSQAQVEHPEAFLYRMALSLAADEHHRSRVRRAEPLEALDDEESLTSPSPQTAVDQGRRLDNLQCALAELPVIYRSSFLLRKPDGLSHSQIAGCLSISRSLVEKHIIGAIKHCRVRMHGWEAD